MNFGAYQKQQIIDIIEARLYPVQDSVFDSRALGFLGQKLSDFGDIRKVLDIVIDIIKTHKSLMETKDPGGPSR